MKKSNKVFATSKTDKEATFTIYFFKTSINQYKRQTFQQTTKNMA